MPRVAKVASASVDSTSFINQGTVCTQERKKSSENDILCIELSLKAGIHDGETTDLQFWTTMLLPWFCTCVYFLF